jgi:hypothetical protein
MNAGARRRRPRAVLGFLKAVGMLFVLLAMIPVWLIRGASARARFRSELRAAGVPQDAARRLSERYKVRLRDFRKLRPAEE